MACWGSPVSSSVNIKDEWALADIFVSDSNTHKALLNIVPVPLLRAGLTGAEALSSMRRLTTRDGQGLARRGQPIGSHPPRSNLLWKHFVKQMFVCPKSKPWSPPLICLSAQPLTFYSVSWLVWTRHFPRPEQIWSLATSPRIHNLTWAKGLDYDDRGWKRKQHCNVNQLVVAQHLNLRSNLIIFQVTLQIGTILSRVNFRAPAYSGNGHFIFFSWWAPATSWRD